MSTRTNASSNRSARLRSRTSASLNSSWLSRWRRLAGRVRPGVERRTQAVSAERRCAYRSWRDKCWELLRVVLPGGQIGSRPVRAATRGDPARADGQIGAEVFFRAVAHPIRASDGRTTPPWLCRPGPGRQRPRGLRGTSPRNQSRGLTHPIREKCAAAVASVSFARRPGLSGPRPGPSREIAATVRHAGGRRPGNA